LLDRVKIVEKPVLIRQRLGLTPDQKLVVLMPGSRRQEIKRLLKPMLAAAALIAQKQTVKWVLPAAASLKREWLESFVAGQPVKVELVNEAYDMLAAADAAVIASGTATLEAAILTTPMVIIYRVAPLSLFIYKMLMNRERRRQPWVVGLPNLIMGRKVVPELLQSQVTPKNIAIKLQNILAPSQNRLIREELGRITDIIGPPGVMQRAAQAIRGLLARS
jgi:lipid-A-disaccharide synthase